MLGLTYEALAAPLLPLREKVSAKPTDEGFQRGARGLAVARPLIRPASRATFSRKGRRKLFRGMA